MNQEKEFQPVKYIRELQDYFNEYIAGIIDEIYVGVGINLGLSEKVGYNLALNPPDKLQKGFFSNLIARFKNIFSHRPAKFRYKKKLFGDGKSMTPEQWAKFNEYMDRYWREYAHKVTEDVVVKSYLLGKETAEFKRKNKPYQNKSLYQVVKDQYNGKMPATISEAYKRYDFKNFEKKALNKAFSQTAMYVTQTNNEIKEAIRQQVQTGMEEGKSGVEIASDLYWNVEKNKDLRTRKYTAETLKHNWNRVASYETAAIYEAGQLAPYEAEAMESMKDPAKAQYMVRVNGTCPWCRSLRGSVVRLVPTSIVSGDTDSLKAMGIEDAITDTAIWIGKNNIGRKQADWWNCAPGHPHNIATYVSFDPAMDFYNPKSDDVEKLQVKQKFVPQLKDVTFRSKEEIEKRKPHFIGEDLVQYNNNVYKRVDPGEYIREKAKWDKNPSLPIPIATDSTRYDKIFGEAERNAKRD